MVQRLPNVRSHIIISNFYHYYYHSESYPYLFVVYFIFLLLFIFVSLFFSHSFCSDAEEASSADGSHIAGAKNKSSSSSAAANTAAAADARGVHKLEAFMQRFDGESSWVAREVCMQQGDRDRADMIVRFLSIAKHLIALNNFYSSFAVVVGLKMTPVRRMSAWSFVPEKWYIIEHACDVAHCMSFS